MQDASTMKVMNLGVVRITHDHDKRQFFNAVLLCVLVLILTFWALQEGLLVRMYSAIGMPFAIAFVFLLASGLLHGVAVARKLSQGMDAIKNAEGDATALRYMFDMKNFTEMNIHLVKEQVNDKLFVQADPVRHAANLAAVVGLFGTVWGLLGVLGTFGKISSPDDVFRQLPHIGAGLELSFATTLVGMAVYVPLIQMHRFLRNASLELKNRMFRVLHAQVQKEAHEAI